MATSSKFVVKADFQLPGIVTVMNGFWEENDVNDWAAQFADCLNKNFINKNFKVLADMRQFQPASKKVQDKITDIQKKAKSKNLVASAVVTDNILSKNQMKRLAEQTGVNETEDYFINYDVAYKWLKQISI